MEKKRLTGRDILRMDGLLPPTRRLPVCDAVSTDKKKDKKWSIGNIFKRISSIRDYDSSSNEEEIVYCKREPTRPIKLSKKSKDIVLRPISDPDPQGKQHNSAVPKTKTKSNLPGDSLECHRDSSQSHSSNGSLDAFGKRPRKNKVKTRIQAKREFLCPESSSDEESWKSCNSLTRSQEEGIQNSQKNGNSRRTRAARTERYIKRLSKDEGNNDNFSKIHYKQSSIEHLSCTDPNKSYRPPVHPRPLTQSSSQIFSTSKMSTEHLYEPHLGIPTSETIPVCNSAKQCYAYIMDLNQNNAYEKYILSSNKGIYGKLQKKDIPSTRNASKVFNDPPEQRPRNDSANPPTPPPRDSRSFARSCHSFPSNVKQQRIVLPAGGKAKIETNLRSYGSNNEITRCGTTVQKQRRPMSLNSEFPGIYNNRNNSATQNTCKVEWRNEVHVEAAGAKHRKKNNNDQFALNSVDRRLAGADENKLSKSDVSSAHTQVSSHAPGSLEFLGRGEQPSRTTIDKCDRSDDPKKPAAIENAKLDEEALARKRNSKNLEEALCELEAIYNSLRLCDEDLLDRAEQRSMEEFSLRRSKNEEEIIPERSNSPDRSKDDMAYRRMNPKERPSSLSETPGQSCLSNISYLIASPVLARKDVLEDLITASPTRKNEPNVTLDDVVFRSINRANNTLKVLDPQPPFGIPLGPVTAATESDYLHTTPKKPESPRSLYIPQSEPDLVMDDLAYRTLRKDAVKNVEDRIEDGFERTNSNAFMGRKKRAVRSLSANLYGLINQDKIHLRKQPAIPRIDDDNCRTAFTKRFERRRVVSDGELSDFDDRWSSSESKDAIDINGNLSLPGTFQRKLRVYMSPIATVEGDKESSDVNKQSSPSSDASLSTKILEDELCTHSDSNISTSSKKSTEPDFTAYARLCQDLVDFIKVPEVKDVPALEEAVDAVVSAENMFDRVTERVNESTSPCTESLDNHTLPEASGSKLLAENKVELKETTWDTNETSERNVDSNRLEYYFRLADENVKIIAEAFSDVADHIRDSTVTKKNLVTNSTGHSKTKESSVSCEPSAEEEIHEEFSSATEESDAVPKTGALITKEEDQIPELSCFRESNLDVELSKAVHELEIAAASLRDNVKKSEKDLQPRFLRRELPSTPSMVMEESDGNAEREERERDQEETVIPTALEAQRQNSESREGERMECKLDRKACAIKFVQSTKLCGPYVINLIIVTITTYSVLLFAYFLALLLAAL